MSDNIKLYIKKDGGKCKGRMERRQEGKSERRTKGRTKTITVKVKNNK